MTPGRVIWITGLSGSGKTTLCESLVSRMRSRGDNVIMLDGDILRHVFGMQDGYSRDDRVHASMRYARLAQSLVMQGCDVAIATISMYNEIYKWNRENFSRYVEIFVDVPMDELVRRDPKGIYKRAMSGELKNVAGVDLVVDLPVHPHIHLVWTEGMSADSMLSEIQNYLEKNNDE